MATIPKICFRRQNCALELVEIWSLLTRIKLGLTWTVKFLGLFLDLEVNQTYILLMGSAQAQGWLSFFFLEMLTYLWRG